jgi:uncharacterized RDD family membrane protein YckC
VTSIDPSELPPVPETAAGFLPAYVTFPRRLQAMLYDSACIMIAVSIAVSLVAFGEPFAGAGRVAAAAIGAAVLLYEPLMVSVFGGTLGHRRRNMRVVADATGSSPGIVRAALRFALKTILGLPSFVAMAVTTRHQALHDQLTRTSVQIRDLTIADASDYRHSRPELPLKERASAPRRMLMVIGYCVAIALFAVVVLGRGVSRECLEVDQCSRTDQVIADGLLLGWLLASVWAAMAGWRGRLPGTRGAHRPGSDAT